jgi:hypothetical protein
MIDRWWWLIWDDWYNNNNTNNNNNSIWNVSYVIFIVCYIDYNRSWNDDSNDCGDVWYRWFEYTHIISSPLSLSLPLI